MRTWLFAAALAASSMAAPVLGEDLAGAGRPSPPPPPAEAEHGFTPQQAAYYIADIQQQLTARGYYAGAINGQMSPALRTAISVYQSDVSMRVTGMADLAVVNMLRFGPDVKASIRPLGDDKPVAGDNAALAKKPPVEIVMPSAVPPYEAPAPFRHSATPGLLYDPSAPPLPSGKAKEEPPPAQAAPRNKVDAAPLAPSGTDRPMKAAAIKTTGGS